MKKIIITLAVVLGFLSMPRVLAQGTCITTSTNGPYTVGIKVTYETLANGTDVKVTFQLLDLDKTVDLAYLWNPDPNFSETIMTKEADNTFSLTLAGQSGTISKACKLVINGGGQINTEYIAYEVNTDCTGTTNDVTPPNNFTASVEATTAFSVELLLNATDDSGTVAYYIAYGGITKGISTDSNVSKSVFITGLDPETDYNFLVSAIDLAGNTAANNPIVLAASTIVDASTPCEGTSDESSDGGVFQIGYNYKFETLPNGTDVRFTVELLDDRPYGNVYLHRGLPTFMETGPIPEVSPKVWSTTVAQTAGTTISYAFKIEFAPGQAITKYFSYDVGDACTLAINDLELSAFNVFPNPAIDSWTVSTNNTKIASIQVLDILGKNVMTLKPNANEVVIDATSLKDGVYFAQIITMSGMRSLKLIKN